MTKVAEIQYRNMCSLICTTFSQTILISFGTSKSPDSFWTETFHLVQIPCYKGNSEFHDNFRWEGPSIALESCFTLTLFAVIDIVVRSCVFVGNNFPSKPHNVHELRQIEQIVAVRFILPQWLLLRSVAKTCGFHMGKVRSLWGFVKWKLL